MKKLLILALAMILALSLAACGKKAPAPEDNAAPDASQQEPSDADAVDPGTPDEATPDEATLDEAAPEAAPDEAAPEAAPGEVTDFDTGISTIPAEWQKAIGNNLYGMNTGVGDDYSDSYTNKFGGVSAEDYAKLIAYFDTLSYTEKLDGVYNCDWGQLQIDHNADASEMTISWYVN